MAMEIHCRISSRSYRWTHTTSVYTHYMAWQHRLVAATLTNSRYVLAYEHSKIFHYKIALTLISLGKLDSAMATTYFFGRFLTSTTPAFYCSHVKQCYFLCHLLTKLSQFPFIHISILAESSLQFISCTRLQWRQWRHQPFKGLTPCLRWHNLSWFRQVRVHTRHPWPVLLV